MSKMDTHSPEEKFWWGWQSPVGWQGLEPLMRSRRRDSLETVCLSVWADGWSSRFTNTQEVVGSAAGIWVCCWVSGSWLSGNWWLSLEIGRPHLLLSCNKNENESINQISQAYRITLLAMTLIKVNIWQGMHDVYKSMIDSLFLLRRDRFEELAGWLAGWGCGALLVWVVAIEFLSDWLLRPVKPISNWQPISSQKHIEDWFQVLQKMALALHTNWLTPHTACEFPFRLNL